MEGLKKKGKGIVEKKRREETESLVAAAYVMFKLKIIFHKGTLKLIFDCSGEMK